MKISRLCIRGFGKLENFNTDFSKGLNIVYGPNESGKSTLMSFIKAELYGLKGGRTTKDGIPALKRYAPWTKAAYGGYLDLEMDNGQSFRIDRDFDKGSVKLFDSSFNDITNDFLLKKDAAGIAEKLIGLNQSLFERTVYISQMGARIDQANSKDLIERISNLGKSGSEDISVKNAVSALKDALKQQVGTDKSYTRPLDIINKRLEDLNEYKFKETQRKKEISGLKERLKGLDAEIGCFLKKEKLFSELIEFLRVTEKLKFLKDKKEQLDFIELGINQCSINLNNINKEKEDIINELEKKAQSQRTSVKIMNLFCIVSIISAIAVGWGAFIFETIPKISILIPLFLAVIFLGLRIKNNSSLKVINTDIEEYAQITDKLLYQQLQNLAAMIISQKAQYEQLLVRQKAQFEGFDPEDIIAAEKSLTQINGSIIKLIKDNENYLTQEERQIINDILDKGLLEERPKVEHMKDNMAEQIHNKKLQYGSIEAEINRNLKEENIEIIDEELRRLNQQKRNLEQRGRALNIAIRTLEESAKDVQKKYVPVMNKVFKNAFSAITENKYTDIRAGDNLNIMINDPDAEMVIPYELLSSGTIDQLYLSLRMAISETVLEKNERMPFIMDELFAQYDDQRTESALKQIYEISRVQQVIMFTCKKREVDMVSSRYPCKICSLT